jgi:hypothetical protein
MHRLDLPVPSLVKPPQPIDLSACGKALAGDDLETLEEFVCLLVVRQVEGALGLLEADLILLPLGLLLYNGIYGLLEVDLVWFLIIHLLRGFPHELVDCLSLVHLYSFHLSKVVVGKLDLEIHLLHEGVELGLVLVPLCLRRVVLLIQTISELPL